MSHWGLYIIRVKRVYFHHPARNARIAFRVSKTGKYGKKGYQIHRSPGQVHLRSAERVEIWERYLGAGLMRTRGSSSFRGAFQRVIYADDLQASMRHTSPGIFVRHVTSSFHPSFDRKGTRTTQWTRNSVLLLNGLCRLMYKTLDGKHLWQT